MTFPEFWDIWPRKLKKQKARRLYEAITNGGFNIKDAGQTVLLQATHVELLHGAREYAREVCDTEQRYILHATTWLRGEGWADYEPEALDGTWALRAQIYKDIVALEEIRQRRDLQLVEELKLEGLRERIKAIQVDNVVKLRVG